MTARTERRAEAPTATSGPPVVPSPDLSRRSRTRQRLLDAALDVFAEHGVHLATVEEITERAGFTRGAFYSNFTTKEELFFALVEREDAVRAATLGHSLEELRPRIGAALAAGDESTLGAVLVHLFLGPGDDRRWYLVQAEFRMLAMRDRAVAPRLVDHERRFYASLLPVMERAIEQAGREFVLATEATLHLLARIYQDALEATVLAGQDVPDLDRLRTDLARTVLVLTRPRTT